MRLAFVSMTGIPSRTAQSINIYRACSAMAQLGHEVRLVVPREHPDRLREIEDCDRYYGVEGGFSTVFLPCPKVPGGRTWFSLRAAAHLLRWRPRLVIGRYLRATLFCALGGLDTVYELHAPVKKKGRMLARLAATGRLRLVVTHTGPLREKILSEGLEGLTGENVISLPHGRQPPAAAASPLPLRKTTSGLDIGYTGKLQVQKGMGLIANLAPLIPDHDLHIAGGGERDVALWKDRIPQPNVHFYGYLPQNQIDAFVASLDICLLPNEPHPENPPGILYSNPIKLLDYMANHRVTFASDLGEIREVLDETCAVLLPAGDAGAWARAINGADPGDLRRLGAAAAARFGERLTLQARYREIIRRAL